MMRCSDSGGASCSAALQLSHSLAQPADLGCHRRQRFRQRIVDLLGIGNHHPFAVAEDDMAGHSHYRRVLGNTPQHHRSRANAAVLPYRDVPQHFRAPSDNHIGFDGRMPLPVLFPGTSQGDALIEGHVVSDLGGLSNHHTHAVIDEQPPADLRSWVNFNSGEKARDLRPPASPEKEAVIPEPVIDAVEPHRVQTGITEEDLGPRLRGRIALHHRGNVFTN